MSGKVLPSEGAGTAQGTTGTLPELPELQDSWDSLPGMPTGHFGVSVQGQRLH